MTRQTLETLKGIINDIIDPQLTVHIERPNGERILAEIDATLAALARSPRTPADPSAAVTEQEKRNTWILPAAEEIISRIRQGTGLGIAFHTVCGIIAKHHATYLAKSPAPTPAPTPERIAGEQGIDGVDREELMR